MHIKEELHALIHSLSKSEKRYFTLFCKRESSGSNYLKLFNAIDRQEEYDEAAIKRQFRDQTFVKQLHVTKNYLRKILLKSLRNYHTGISKNAQLKAMLQNVEILYNKGLYTLSIRELNKAERIAREYELLTGLVEIEAWRRKLTQVMEPQHYTSIREALDTQAEAIELLQNLNDYWRLATESSGDLLGGEGKVSTSPLLNNPDRALTLEAKGLFYNANYLKNLHKGNNDEAEKSLRVLVELLEQHEQRVEQDPDLYVSSINNLVSFLVFTRQYEEALITIRKAKELYGQWDISSGNHTLLKQMLRTMNIELEIYRDEKLYHENPGFIEPTEAFVTDNEDKMPREYLLSFWFQLATIHFMRKDFKRALHWNNMLVNTKHRDTRVDLQLQARMLNLMIHLEQQNLTVLRHFADSTRRYLDKRKEVQPFEEILMRFFIKIGRLPLLEYKSAFRELREQLFPEKDEPLIPLDILGYINYREWIDEKLSS